MLCCVGESVARGVGGADKNQKNGNTCSEMNNMLFLIEQLLLRRYPTNFDMCISERFNPRARTMIFFYRPPFASLAQGSGGKGQPKINKNMKE